MPLEPEHGWIAGISVILTLLFDRGIPGLINWVKAKGEVEKANHGEDRKGTTYLIAKYKEMIEELHIRLTKVTEALDQLQNAVAESRAKEIEAKAAYNCLKVEFNSLQAYVIKLEKQLETLKNG